MTTENQPADRTRQRRHSKTKVRNRGKGGSEHSQAPLKQEKGVLTKLGENRWVLAKPERGFRATPKDIQVPAHLVDAFQIDEGATLEGPVRNGQGKPRLARINTICGMRPSEFHKRTPFSQLTAVDPCDKINLAVNGDLSMRVIDLLAPIGLGSRALIVSPPKAGKTMILEAIAKAVRKDKPNVRLMVLLVDERPEEVTNFRRSVDAEVLASTSDRRPQEHIELTEGLLAHVRTELECGRDIVILVDSLTRMGRAFNHKDNGRANDRIMSGGLGAGALEVPRRFFGLARNIEHGGSVTIIATALVDTNSRMDELIFQEFKGTGNCEIVLDRNLADRRIFPAINVHETGTRKEERLHGEEAYRRISLVRRALADYQPREMIEAFLKQLRKHKTNEEFLASIPVDGK